MARPATSLSREFSGHLRYLEFTRTKMEKLLANGDIVTRDINQVYVGLYLEVTTSFESLIENLFIGLLSGRLLVESKSIVPLVSFKNMVTVRAIVYGGRNYADWLPYRHTEDRAGQFFWNGAPFSCLNAREKELIANGLYIRNAIAHKSKHASNIFESHVLGNQVLMSRERTPEGYLRSIFRTAPVQNRYENFMHEMASIATKLCS